MNLSDSQDLINLDNVPIILSKTPLSNTFEYEITDIESANLDCENNYSVTCSSINTSQTEKEENSFSKNILKETDTNKLQISKTPIQSHIPKDDSINQTLDQGINQSLNDNNENNAPLVKKCINDKNVFASSFPVKYLPAKKKKKIEASGKPKPPVAGTSDIYYNYITEKEKQKEVKDEQSESKKKLTSQKQILMKKKQKLIEDIRICAEKIKQEESDEIKKNLYKEQKKLVDEKYDIEIKITNLQKQISNLMFENKIVE